MAVSHLLDDDLEERVEKLADKRGQSSDMIVQEAVTEFVSRAEARERFWREGEEAWEEYQRTGLHLTGEELFDWLSKWGTDAEVPLPKCHK